MHFNHPSCVITLTGSCSRKTQAPINHAGSRGGDPLLIFPPSYSTAARHPQNNGAEGSGLEVAVEGSSTPSFPLLVSLLWIPSALPDCEAEPLAISGLGTALLNNCQDMSSSACKSQQHWAFLLFKTLLPSTPPLAAGEKWACYKRHILSIPWPFCLPDIIRTCPSPPASKGLLLHPWSFDIQTFDGERCQWLSFFQSLSLRPHRTASCKRKCKTGKGD